MRRLFPIVAIAMLVEAPDALAQNNGFVCDGAAFDIASDWQLASLRAPDLSALQTSREWRFEFDLKRHGFDSIQFYVSELGPFNEVMGGTVGPVEIVVRIGGDRATWFRVVPKTGASPDGTLLGYAGMARAAGKRDVEPMVRQIDPLSGEPVFAFDLQELNTSAQIHTKFVIDLRNGRKRVPLALTCAHDRILGACGAYDNQYQFEGQSLDCAWSRNERELFCTSSTGVETHWGGRAGRREFALPGQRDRAAPIRGASISQVEQLARAFDETAKPTQITTAEFGVVQALAAVPRRSGGRIVVLGAQGISSSFGARFFVVVFAPNARAVIAGIPERHLSRRPWISEYEITDVTIDARPEPVDVAFHVERLASTSLQLLRVRVSEGDWRAAYLIAVDDRGATPLVDALRTATNTVDYYQCMRAFTTPNAISMTVAPGDSFAIDLDVEPPRQVNVDTFAPMAPDSEFVIDAGSTPECAARVRVTWGAGFLLGQPEMPPGCKTSPARFVDIKDNGEVVQVKQLRPRDPQ